MKYEIRCDNVVITDAIKSYIEEKLGKLNKYFTDATQIKAKILLKIRGREQIIEATIPTKSFTLRNEECSTDLYAAIDLLTDKLERQIVKNKTKIQNKTLKNYNSDFNLKDCEDIEEEKNEIIVKRKKLDTKPMGEEEAILEMNMLGHDFFIYRDSETNGVNILYKRKDGNYGVIETK